MRTLFFIVIAFLINPSVFSQCGGLDVFIANDQSGSVDAQENVKSRDFITQLAASLPLGYTPGGFRIAIADFEHFRNWQQFTFPGAGKNYTTSLADVKAYANAPRIYSTGTDLQLALMRSFQAVQADLDQSRPKVILLMTDAQPGNASQESLIELADQIKNSGVYIAVMAIDDARYFTDLIKVASTGGYFFADSYALLAEDAARFSQEIADAACKGNQPAYDLGIELTAFDGLGCFPGPGTYTLHYTIRNTGKKAWNNDITISLYDNDPSQYGTQPITVFQTGTLFIDAGAEYKGVFSSNVLAGHQKVSAIVNFDGVRSALDMPVYPARLMPLLLVPGERSSDNNASALIPRNNGLGCVPRATIKVNVVPDGMGCGNTTGYTVQLCNTGNLDTKINSFLPVADPRFALVNAEETITNSTTNFYHTYFGGNRDDYAYGATADAFGAMYITGQSNSPNAIASTGAYRTNNGNTQDAFLAKFNAQGNRVWATYFGGAGSENGYSVATDAAGNVYIAGETSNSPGLATTGAAQVTSGGGYDAYLAKFNANGVLLWATYYGGSGADYGRSVAIDQQGNVYLAGNTTSINGIATVGAHQPTIGGGNDAFLAKFNPNGVRLWGTYYGGTGTESGFGVAIDAIGHAYLTGVTASTNNIASAGSFQTVKGAGNDAYLVQFDANGVRQWGTYLGGNNSDNSTGITTDEDGSVYIAGNTASTNIATTGSHQPVNNGNTDGFLAKFTGNGNLSWCTYYGGNGLENGRQVNADGKGNIYLSGNTASTTDIATANGIQPAYGGNTDAFLVKFDKQGNRLWGTYFGGAQQDIASAAVIDVMGKVYLTGATQSPQMATLYSWQDTYGGGGNDAFLLKIMEEGAFIVKAGECVTFRYYYNVSAATGSVHDFSYVVGSEGVYPNDPPAIVEPDANGFDGTKHTTDDVTLLTNTPACTPGDKISVQLKIPPVQSCGSASYLHATITINNTSGITLRNALLQLNLTGSNALFSGELYNRSVGLQTAQPNIGDQNYPAVPNALHDKSGAFAIPLYQVPPGVSTLQVEMSAGDGAVALSAQVTSIAAFFNASTQSNVAIENNAVTLIPLPAIDGWQAPVEVLEDDVIQLKGITTLNAQSLEWVSATIGKLANAGSLQAPALQYTPTAADKENGYVQLSLAIVNATGCDAARTAQIKLKKVSQEETLCGPFAPNAFTPNNDGRNDAFKLQFRCTVRDYRLIIYNRWGGKVFDSTEPGAGWDGLYGGSEQPAGGFIWYCRCTINGQAQTKKGLLTLIR